MLSKDLHADFSRTYLSSWLSPSHFLHFCWRYNKLLAEIPNAEPLSMNSASLPLDYFIEFIIAIESTSGADFVFSRRSYKTHWMWRASGSFA